MKKIALVTGVSKGIGFSIAESLLKEGYKVYGISRTQPKIVNPDFVWLKIDLHKPEEIKMLTDLVLEEDIHILVNNAGIAIARDSLNFDLECFNSTFGLNLIAPVLICQNLIKKLKNTLIINISSLSDRIPDSDYAIYCASKASLNIYFDSILTHYKNLRVIDILPSYVDTPLLRGLIKDVNFNWDKIIKPTDIAELTVEITKKADIPNKSRIFVITDSLKEDVNNPESIYVYNSTNRTLKTLKEFNEEN